MRQEGSIGYVAYDRVQKQRLAAVALKNADGQFALPSEPSIQAAVRGSGLVDNRFASLLNARGADAWPIAELTYVLIPSDAQRAAAAGPTLQFFAWALQKGDAIVRQTGFVALPRWCSACAAPTARCCPSSSDALASAAAGCAQRRAASACFTSLVPCSAPLMGTVSPARSATCASAASRRSGVSGVNPRCTPWVRVMCAAS